MEMIDFIFHDSSLFKGNFWALDRRHAELSMWMPAIFPMARGRKDTTKGLQSLGRRDEVNAAESYPFSLSCHLTFSPMCDT